MKTFIMKHDPMLLNIKNIERVDEVALCEEVISIFSKTDGIEIGAKITGPSEDVYRCTFEDKEFALIYSLDDGVSLRFYDKNLLETVQNLLEKA